jgi:hypothetical protein
MRVWTEKGNAMKILFLALLLLFQTCLMADDVLPSVEIEHITVNAAGGDFVLTEKPCDIAVRDPANTRLAWSEDESKTKHYGCWSRMDKMVSFEFDGEPGLHTWHVRHFRTRIVGPIGTEPAAIENAKAE